MPLNTDPEESWFRIKNPEDIASPALLVYPHRIEENIGRMVSIAGSPERLWPHVKTHKMSEVVRLQLKAGISRFKCATVAESEMAASAGADEIILAIQPVGPAIERFINLQLRFPSKRIGCIADNADIIKSLSSAASDKGIKALVWLDLNIGMNRTGIEPGPEATALYSLINDLQGTQNAGLHVYDGHLHDADAIAREKKCNDAYRQAESFISRLESMRFRTPVTVAGGTPTFPIHAKRKNTDCSPGTLLLWDYKSSSTYRDMDFLHAAVLLARVVSKPSPDLACIDLGHKAVASEMPHPRVRFFGIDSYETVNHSEEHIVIRTEKATLLKPGDILYCIPYHICPTTDRFTSVSVVRDGMASEEWQVDAHTRKITI
ncbi:MAG: D-TA family PLP-dependent enzyme [Bacteroidales bacterium]|nr:D-TA family PLP-dependent enzyme [Bacteroidales bacterium]MCU0408060.1 D-TA family PLP-dependent enzyme [Bacteroidales bacterium]